MGIKVIRLRKERRFRKCKKNGIPQYGEYRIFGKKMKYVRQPLTVNNNAVYRLKRVVNGRHWHKEGNGYLNMPSRKHFKRSKRQFTLINIFGISKPTHWRKNVLPL